MILKGKVSSLEINGARVTFQDRENIVSSALQVASDVGTLKVGENVAAVFFSDNMNDGLIIARW